VPLRRKASNPAGLMRLARADEVRLTLLEPLHMQIDGEPWLQPSSVVHVAHHAAADVLRAPASKRPGSRQTTSEAGYQSGIA